MEKHTSIEETENSGAATPPVSHPKPRKPQERKNLQGDRTRLQIIESSCALFAANGYAGVSLRDIAEKINIPASLIIHHFSTKADLYRAVVASVFKEGFLYTRSVQPIKDCNTNDKQATANAIAESLHIAFGQWYGRNRVKYASDLLVQTVLGTGTVEKTLAIEWILPIQHILEDFFFKIDPKLTLAGRRIRLEMYFANIFYPAMSRKVFLAHLGSTEEFPPGILLEWEQNLAGDLCAGLGLPKPTFVYPENEL